MEIKKIQLKKGDRIITETPDNDFIVRIWGTRFAIAKVVNDSSISSFKRISKKDLEKIIDDSFHLIVVSGSNVRTLDFA